MAIDASVHKHECREEKHEGETSGTKNSTESLNTVAQNVETRLSQAIAEKVKAEKLFEELQKASQLSKAETREAMSEEERYMLRKVGLKMKPFLWLGRRGVFDGTVLLNICTFVGSIENLSRLYAKSTALKMLNMLLKR